jgi:hypothetical protein
MSSLATRTHSSASPWVIVKSILNLYCLDCTVHTFHKIIYMHTYHSRFIPEGVSDASQIFLQDAHVLPKLFNNEQYFYSFLRGVTQHPAPDHSGNGNTH